MLFQQIWTFQVIWLELFYDSRQGNFPTPHGGMKTLRAWLKHTSWKGIRSVYEAIEFHYLFTFTFALLQRRVHPTKKEWRSSFKNLKKKKVKGRRKRECIQTWLNLLRFKKWLIPWGEWTLISLPAKVSIETNSNFANSFMNKSPKHKKSDQLLYKARHNTLSQTGKFKDHPR